MNGNGFHHEEYARQLILFRGIESGTATPTDIDGFIEKGGRAFLFYEFKAGGAKVPYGQRLALERIVDACRDAHRKAAVFICRHENFDGSDIEAADAIVDAVYCGGKWYQLTHRPTVKAMTERFLKGA